MSSQLQKPATKLKRSFSFALEELTPAAAAEPDFKTQLLSNLILDRKRYKKKPPSLSKLLQNASGIECYNEGKGQQGSRLLGMSKHIKASKFGNGDSIAG